MQCLRAIQGEPVFSQQAVTVRARGGLRSAPARRKRVSVEMTVLTDRPHKDQEALPAQGSFQWGPLPLEALWGCVCN